MPLRLQLLLLFLVSTAIMILLRDVRVPLDGSSYALGVQRLAGGNLEDVFRWSHPLHVPVLFVLYNLADSFWRMDVLTFYQGLDILLGAGGLCLLLLLLRRMGGGAVASMLACLLVMFSWVYWFEAVTADEKMPGFFLVLVYLNLLQKFLGDDQADNKDLTWSKAGVLALVLALSILLHASAVLVVPLSIFLVIRRRAFLFGTMTALFASILVLGAYAWILNSLGTTGRDGIISYFSSGVSRFSIAATGITGTLWARSVAQGMTKLLWAVFSEDGMAMGLVFAGLNLVFLALAAVVVWRSRRDRHLQGFLVLFLTALAFGTTYAPDAPDSYFLMLIPLSLFFAKTLEAGRLKYPAWGLLVILVVNNGGHYLENSIFRDQGVDRRYQEAIGQHLTPGDALVVLDAEMGMVNGTQTIIPIHAYFNSGLEHIPSSSFFENPTNERFLILAGQGRLFVEGLCFEDFGTRSGIGVEDSGAYRELTRVYDLETIVHFSEYSTSFHRSYKNVFRLTLKSHQ